MSAQAIAVVHESAVAGEVVRDALGRCALRRPGLRAHGARPAGRLDPPALERVRASFDEIYAARYGYANASEPVEVVTWKLSAVGGSPRIALAKAAATSADVRRKSTRRAYFPEARGYADTPVYDRYELAGRDVAHRTGHRGRARVDDGPAAGRDRDGGRVREPDRRDEAGVSAIDPITLGVIWGALQSIAVEIGTTVHRTAYSEQAREGQDFSVAVFDPVGAHGRAGAVLARPHGRDVVRGAQRAGRASGRDLAAGRRHPPERSAARLRSSAGLLHHAARVPRRRARRIRREHPPPHRRRRSAAGQPGRRRYLRLFPGRTAHPADQSLEGIPGAGGHRRDHRREHAHARQGPRRPARPAKRAPRRRAPTARIGGAVRARDPPGRDGRDHRADRGQHARGHRDDPRRRLSLRGLHGRLRPRHRAVARRRDA